MDQEFRFTDVAFCKQHSKLPIGFLQVKKDCPHPSRLACSRCILTYKTVDGFMDVLEVLNDPKALIGKTDQPKGKQALLNEYFNLLEKDAEQFICSFKEDILKQIEKLLNDLKEGIDKCNKFKAEITKVKENLQSSEALQCEKFRQAFKNILKVDNYHQTEQWKQFEGIVQEFVLKFEDQQITELNQAYEKLQKMESVFFKPQLLSDFKSCVSKSVEVLFEKLEGMKVSPSSLCDHLYFDELITRIRNKKEGCPKVTLLFKGSIHGLNGKTFWEKCSDKGPTLVICKSKSGYVFGGYTPCEWLPNLNYYQKDESKTSFVFSYTRKEIYPITTGDNAIFCSSSNYGPIFGNGNQFYIDLNFQDGRSNMDGKSYSNESYKIENPKTHLMGGEKPELVEMEVFLVE